MIDEILKEIAKTEEAAAEIERQAAAEAARLVQEARTAANRLQETGITQDEQRITDVLAAFAAESDAEMTGKLAEAARETEAVRCKARSNMDAAVAMIVKGVVGEDGHR